MRAPLSEPLRLGAVYSRLRAATWRVRQRAWNKVGRPRPAHLTCIELGRFSVQEQGRLNLMWLLLLC